VIVTDAQRLHPGLRSKRSSSQLQRSAAAKLSETIGDMT
jgi:hypothetical protein